MTSSLRSGGTISDSKYVTKPYLYGWRTCASMPLLIDTPEVLCASQVAERYRSEWNPTGITRDCQPKTRGELHVGAKSPNWRSHGSPAHSPVGRSDPAGPLRAGPEPQVRRDPA